MEKSKVSLEDIIFKRIKEGNGTVYEILSVTRNYDFKIIDVNRTLHNLLDKNAISKSGNKFIVNE